MLQKGGGIAGAAREGRLELSVTLCLTLMGVDAKDCMQYEYSLGVGEP